MRKMRFPWRLDEAGISLGEEISAEIAVDPSRAVHVLVQLPRRLNGAFEREEDSELHADNAEMVVHRCAIPM
jgi:hypothetical protein